jgi:hypothetical protein
MISVDNDAAGRPGAGRNSADNKEQQVSESNSVVGRIVARDYDDSPVPFTGGVLGQVDEETLEVAWGSEQDAGYPRGTYEPVDGLRPIRS